MCYGMGCRYERKGRGPDAGECTVSGELKPNDAACMWKPEFPDCENCDNGAFTECDGYCMEEFDENDM